MVKKVLLGLVVVLGGLAAFVASRPSAFEVERSVTTSASAEVAFAFVNDFHKWAAWSPWEKLDPAMKKTYEGPAEGVGAVYTWAGNDEVGKGRMTIVESERPRRVALTLEFIEPWAATNRTTFTFAPLGDATRVTWTMEGENDFVGKAFGLFFDMDAMVGGDFEKGLAALKDAAEAEEKAAAEAQAKAAAEAEEKAAAEAQAKAAAEAEETTAETEEEAAAAAP